MVCRFRHLLEQHDLGRAVFEAVHVHLENRGVRVSTGTIVDATIIEAPSSTKNASGQRDPDMHQTRKGQQWYFGMKAHIGTDSKTKVIHAVVATAAKMCMTLPFFPISSIETRQATGVIRKPARVRAMLIHEHAPNAKNFTNRRCRRRGVTDPVEKARNRTKSKVRACTASGC